MSRARPTRQSFQGLVAVRLGIPESLAGASLPRRLAWITAARLFFLMLALALLGVYVRGGLKIGSFTVQVAVALLAVSFALAGVYAAVLRSGRRPTLLAHAQLVLDQLTWDRRRVSLGGSSERGNILLRIELPGRSYLHWVARCRHRRGGRRCVIWGPGGVSAYRLSGASPRPAGLPLRQHCGRALLLRSPSTC